jgi:uncharacterized Fe-S radical SAM superfamily protein PflX
MQVAERVKPSMVALDDERRDLRRAAQSRDPTTRRTVNAALRKIARVEMQMEREASKEVLQSAQVCQVKCNIPLRGMSRGSALLSQHRTWSSLCEKLK